MTYLKCTSCKARSYSAATSGGFNNDVCPSCGATLEPVGELVERVGYRSTQLRADPAPPWTGHGATTARFADLLTANHAGEDQADRVYDALVTSREAASLAAAAVVALPVLP